MPRTPAQIDWTTEKRLALQDEYEKAVVAEADPSQGPPHLQAKVIQGTCKRLRARSEFDRSKTLVTPKNLASILSFITVKPTTVTAATIPVASCEPAAPAAKEEPPSGPSMLAVALLDQMVTIVQGIDQRLMTLEARLNKVDACVGDIYAHVDLIKELEDAPTQPEALVVSDGATSLVSPADGPSVSDEACDIVPLSADEVTFRKKCQTRRVVIVGGNFKEHVVKRFRNRFGVHITDESWFQGMKKDKCKTVAAWIAQRSPAFVVIYQKAISHDLAKAAREACRAHNLSYVQTHTFNPAKLATQFLEFTSAAYDLDDSQIVSV